MIRRLAISDLCERRGNFTESTLHVLRDCVKSRKVWKDVGMCFHDRDQLTMNTKEWIAGRNYFIFNGKKLGANTVVLLNIKFAKEVVYAFNIHTHESIPIHEPIHVKWKYPSFGQFKLNIDESFVARENKASYGGLFRNDQGGWILGFYGRIGNTSINNAELLSIHNGLLIAKEKEWSNITVETDSQVARYIINKDSHDSHPMEHVIEECRKILDYLGGILQHTYREGNLCTDKMAFLGGNQDQLLCIMEKPPVEVENLLYADLVGIEYPRF